MILFTLTVLVKHNQADLLFQKTWRRTLLCDRNIRSYNFRCLQPLCSWSAKHLGTAGDVSFTLFQPHRALAAPPTDCYWEQHPREKAHQSQLSWLLHPPFKSDLRIPWWSLWGTQRAGH